jgi:isopenicillin-N N-acyltransferase like protein
VMTATASAIPKATRQAQSGKGGLISTLLTHYATCDEVLADQKKLFSDRKPLFMLISDRKKIITLEVGLHGRYAVKVTESGAVAHSNHYLEDPMAEFNRQISASSETRVRRIAELLKTAPKPCDTACFAVMSKDQHDGPNDSLWRTGSTGSCTLSSWILETPAQGAQKLRVLLANPGQPEETHQFVLDEKFWMENR